MHNLVMMKKIIDIEVDDDGHIIVLFEEFPNGTVIDFIWKMCDASAAQEEVLDDERDPSKQDLHYCTSLPYYHRERIVAAVVNILIQSLLELKRRKFDPTLYIKSCFMTEHVLIDNYGDMKVDITDATDLLKTDQLPKPNANFTRPELVKLHTVTWDTFVWNVGVICVDLANLCSARFISPGDYMMNIFTGAFPALNDPFMWSLDFKDFLSKCLRKIDDPDQPRATLEQLKVHPFANKPRISHNIHVLLKDSLNVGRPYQFSDMDILTTTEDN